MADAGLVLIGALFEAAVVAFGAASVALGRIEPSLPSVPRRRKRVITVRHEHQWVKQPKAYTQAELANLAAWDRFIAIHRRITRGFSKRTTAKWTVETVASTGRTRRFVAPDLKAAHEILRYSPSGTATIKFGRRKMRLRIKGGGIEGIDVFCANPGTISRRTP